MICPNCGDYYCTCNNFSEDLKLESALKVLKEISDSCPIINAAESQALNDNEEYAAEIFWKSTRRRRTLARDFLKGLKS